MSFEGQLQDFAAKVEQRRKDLLVGCATEVQRSVVEGSEITGAPGQPVDTGNLRDSWIPEFLGDAEWQTTTKAAYARAVEDNVRDVTFKNHGPHSVALTLAAWPRIVDAVVARLGGEG